MTKMKMKVKKFNARALRLNGPKLLAFLHFSFL
jgi:hypothetical protein